MDIHALTPTGELTEMQMEILKIFSKKMTDDQVNELNDVLCEYFAKKAIEEFDKIEEERGWTKETYKKWSKEHLRKSSKL